MGRKARATANKRAATALQHSRIPGAAAPASPPVLPFLAQACLPLLKSKILALQPHIADLSGDNTSCPITRNLLSDLIAGCIRIGLSDRGLAASAALISLSRGLAHERVSIAAKLSERYHLNQDVNIADPIIVGEVQSWWGDSGNREYVLIDSDEFKDVWGSVTADQGMHKRIRINYKLVMIPLIRAHRQAQTSGLSGPQRANADNSLNALKLRAMAILFHECNHSMRVSMTASLYTPDRLRGWHMQSNSALDGSVRRGEGGWWVEEVTFGGSIEVQELAIEVGPPWLQFTLEAIDVPQGPIRRLLAFVKGEESWWSPAFSDVKRIVDGTRNINELLPLAGYKCPLKTKPKDEVRAVSTVASSVPRPISPPSLPTRGPRSCLIEDPRIEEHVEISPRGFLFGLKDGDRDA